MYTLVIRGLLFYNRLAETERHGPSALSPDNTLTFLCETTQFYATTEFFFFISEEEK